MSSLSPWLAYQEDDDSSSDELGGGDGSLELDDSLDQGSPSSNVKLLLSKSLMLQNDWYCRRRREDDNYNDDMFEFQYLQLLNKNKNSTSTPSSGKKCRRHRSPRTCKRLQPDTIMVPSNEEGVGLHEVLTDPKSSPWFIHYVTAPQLDNPRFHVQFCFCFCVPYTEYKNLLAVMDEDTAFSRWTKCDAVRLPSSPLSLLLRGARRYLGRYLGRGWTFDDLHKATFISDKMHHQFFHVYLDYGSHHLFARYVIAPTNAEEAKTHMKEFAMAGCPRCVASTDATHVTMDKCTYQLVQFHKGPKEQLPARMYNLSANHQHHVLSTTTSHLLHWNDKTIVLFDEFVCGIQEGRYLSDVEFELLERKDTGDIITKKYTDGWVLVDNGYLNWPTTIPPMKHTTK